MSSLYSYSGTSTQVCQHCGSPLLPNEAQCRNCGYYNQMPSSSNLSWGTPAPVPAPPPQTAYGQNQYAQMQWGQSGQSPQNGSAMPQQPSFGAQPQPANPSYPGAFYQSSAQPSSAYLNAAMPGQSGPLWQSQPGQPTQSGQLYAQGNFYGTAGTNGHASPLYANNGYGMPGSSPNYYGASAPVQQAGFYAPAPQSMPGGGNGYQPGGFKQPPGQKSKPKTAMIIGVVVILLVLFGGSFGVYTYLKHSDTPAPTAATPTPTPTPSGPPLFFDTFQNNNKGWDLTSDPGKFSVKLGGGTLVLEDDENRLLPELLPTTQSFSNFRLSVDATLSKGTQENGYGVYIRAASNQNSELATNYRFEIYGDGTYDIFKGSVDANGNSTSSQLVKYNISNAIQKAGSVNHLTIIANGPTMTFIVNGQTIATATDSSYTSGTIALFVSNVSGTTPGAAATFSNLYIYPPQTQ